MQSQEPSKESNGNVVSYGNVVFSNAGYIQHPSAPKYIVEDESPPPQYEEIAECKLVFNVNVSSFCLDARSVQAQSGHYYRSSHLHRSDNRSVIDKFLK